MCVFCFYLHWTILPTTIHMAHLNLDWNGVQRWVFQIFKCFLYFKCKYMLFFIFNQQWIYFSLYFIIFFFICVILFKFILTFVSCYFLCFFFLFFLVWITRHKIHVRFTCINAFWMHLWTWMQNVRFKRKTKYTNITINILCLCFESAHF